MGLSWQELKLANNKIKAPRLYAVLKKTFKDFRFYFVSM
jgi:hypothetical protein